MKIKLRRTVAALLLVAMCLSGTGVYASNPEPAYETESVSAASVDNEKISDARIGVETVDDRNGIYRIWVSDLSASAGIAAVSIPVWSDHNGQDDICWYNAAYNNGAWYADVKLSDHGFDSGKYIAHVYAYDKNGYSKLCAYKEFTAAAPVTNQLSVQLSSDKTKAEIYLTNPSVSGQTASVYFPVWGEVNGQNDIVWYKAQNINGTWTAQVDLKNHSESGTFEVHAYVYNTANIVTLVGSTSFIIPGVSGGKVSVINKDDESGCYQIKISSLTSPFGISQVLVPTWSEKNGQDDILWHEAEKNGADWIVTIDCANHNFETGNYVSHIYVKDGRGVSQLINSVTAQMKASGRLLLKATLDDKQEKMTITLNNYRSNSSAVRFAVWGESGGQNDLCWYDAKRAGNSYTYVVDISQHKEIGRYNIHAYDCTGTPVLLEGISADVNGFSDAKVVISSQDNDYGTFTVNISGMDNLSAVKSIQVPVWSEKNGQDDIRWYTPVKRGDSWYLDVNISDHNDNTGKYQIHVYATDTRGIQQLIGHTTVTMKPSTLAVIPKVTMDLDNSAVSIRVSNVKNAAVVHIPVWGDASGQNDIIWYTAKKISSTVWEAEIDLLNHQEHGDYQAHIYITDTAGIQRFSVNTSFSVPDDFVFAEPLRIVLDPGHDDICARNHPDLGFNEQDLNLAIAKACRDELEKYKGVEVFLTREDGSCPDNGIGSDDVTGRTAYAASVDADLFVSIHNNATGLGYPSSANGAEVYISVYSPMTNESRKLGESILSQLTQKTGLKNRGVLTRVNPAKGYYDDGNAKDWYYLISTSVDRGFPGIIIEHAFMDNPHDNAFLKNPDNLTKMGIADAAGIAAYYGLQKK